ncbi:MAG: hypothetical protein ACQESG_05255 [Nanobdellota archaeon]
MMPVKVVFQIPSKPGELTDEESEEIQKDLIYADGYQQFHF